MIKKLEIFSWFMFVVGIIFRALHFPVSSLLVVISLSVLSILYFIGSYFLFTAKTDTPGGSSSTIEILNTIFTGLILAAVVIGVMFKVQIWPASQDLLGSSLLALGVLLVFQLAMKSRLEKWMVDRIFRRVVFIGGVGLLLYLIPAVWLIDIYYSHRPEFAKALKEYISDPTNLEKQAAYEKVLHEAYPTSQND